MINTDISCVLPRPDIAELSEAVRTELSRRLLGGAPVLPLSSEDILAFVMAGTINLAHGFISQALKEQDPMTMCCDNLATYAERRGIHLLGSTRAKGYVAITGDPEAIIPGTIRFAGASSREYKLDPSVVFNPLQLSATAPAGAVVRVVAIQGGAVYNVDAGTELTVSTVTSGIDGTATVIGNGIIGGTDEEDCDSLRRRVIAAESQDILSLNEAWYIRETLKYPGVTRACLDQCQGCCDSTMILVYPFMEGVYGDITEEPYGVPPCNVLDQMSDWMFGKELGRGQGLAPIGIKGRYQAAIPVPIDVTIRCYAACPLGMEDRVRDALWNYIRWNLCVGSTICKDRLTAAIYRVLGEGCMSKVEYSVPMRYEDSANIYLDCGTFPVLGTIDVNVSYDDRITGKSPRSLPAPAMRSVPARPDRAGSIWARRA